MLVFGYGTSSNYSIYFADFSQVSKQTNLLYELKPILSICMIAKFFEKMRQFHIFQYKWQQPTGKTTIITPMLENQ